MDPNILGLLIKETFVESELLKLCYLLMLFMQMVP